MKARVWDRNKDYETIVSWWEQRENASDFRIPSRRLPPSGWVIESDDGTPLCATWLYYFSHTAGALLGNLVSNPAADPKVRAKALDLLLLRVTTEADRNNCEIIFGMTTREGFLRKAKKHGFSQQSKHSVEFQRERGIAHV